MCSCNLCSSYQIFLKCKAWHLAESCKECHVSSDSLGCGGKVIIKYVHLGHMATLEPTSTAPQPRLTYVAPCHVPEGEGGEQEGREEKAYFKMPEKNQQHILEFDLETRVDMYFLKTIQLGHRRNNLCNDRAQIPCLFAWSMKGACRIILYLCVCVWG